MLLKILYTGRFFAYRHHQTYQLPIKSSRCSESPPKKPIGRYVISLYAGRPAGPSKMRRGRIESLEISERVAKSPGILPNNAKYPHRL